MGRLNSFFRSSRADQWLLIRVTLMVSIVWLGLRMFPFRTIRRGLERAGRGRRASYSPRSDSEAVRISTSVDKAGRNILGKDSCFPQALLGEMLLSRNGFDPQLRIGVVKENAKRIKAHAWVELDGKIVIGGPQSQVEKYTPLPNLDELKF